MESKRMNEISELSCAAHSASDIIKISAKSTVYHTLGRLLDMGDIEEAFHRHQIFRFPITYRYFLDERLAYLCCRRPPCRFLCHFSERTGQQTWQTSNNICIPVTPFNRKTKELTIFLQLLYMRLKGL